MEFGYLASNSRREVLSICEFQFGMPTRIVFTNHTAQRRNRISKVHKHDIGPFEDVCEHDPDIDRKGALPHFSFGHH